MTLIQGGPRGQGRALERLSVALALAVGAVVPVAAQESPWSVGATLSAGRDSNVLRTPTDEVADTTLAAGLRAMLSLPLGRQTL